MLKRIVSTEEYSCEPLVNTRKPKENPVESPLTTENEMKKLPTTPKSGKPTYVWENTNRMLGVSGYIGCKTGITPAAGPCLSACYEKNGSSFIIVLL